MAHAAGSEFDPYADVEANAKALEKVRPKLFAKYLQLNCEAIFADATSVVVPATRLRHETRMVMRFLHRPWHFGPDYLPGDRVEVFSAL